MPYISFNTQIIYIYNLENKIPKYSTYTTKNYKVPNRGKYVIEMWKCTSENTRNITSQLN